MVGLSGGESREMSSAALNSTYPQSRQSKARQQAFEAKRFASSKTF